MDELFELVFEEVLLLVLELEFDDEFEELFDDVFEEVFEELLDEVLEDELRLCANCCPSTFATALASWSTVLNAACAVPAVRSATPASVVMVMVLDMLILLL